MNGVTMRGISPVGLSNIPPGAAPQATPSVLPLPPVATDVGDALGELLKLSSILSEQQSKASMSEASSKGALRKAASEKRMQAINDAIEAERKAQEERESGGLFDFITDNLGPAGLLGLVTGTAYIAAVDFVAHATGLDDSKLDLADAAGLAAMMAGPVGAAVYVSQAALKKFGPEGLQQALDQGPSISDDQTRLANKLMLTISQAHLALTATIMSGGTAAPAIVAMVGVGISTATQIAAQTGALEAVFKSDAKWIALGGSVAGAALTMGSGLAGGISNILTTTKDATSTAVGVLKDVKAVAEGAFSINQGIHNLRAADYQHEADVSGIEAKRQKQILELIERMVDQVIDEMKSHQQSAKRTTEILQVAMQTNNQTQLLASTMKA